MVKSQYTKKMVSWDLCHSARIRAEYQGESKDLVGTGQDSTFSSGLGVMTLSSSAGPSFLFPKVVTSLVVITGESSVPKETPGLDDRVGEPRGGVSILGTMGEGV